MRTRIKICGITRAQDLDSAVHAGADAIGLVFYSKSPRNVPVQTARELCARLPAWMGAVGLFVNAPRDEILRVADAVHLTHLQLHGDETPKDCEGLGRPVIKAIRIGKTPSAQDAERQARSLGPVIREYSHCQAVLLDSDSSGYGGSGTAFDWAVLEALLGRGDLRKSGWILSGGLESGSVGRAIAQFSPPCVDVSSGVERLEGGVPVKGEKDADRIAAFVAEVRLSDEQNASKS